MRRFVFFVMLVAAAFSGCRKKHSMEFGLYKADYTALIDRQGDDAYLTPQMDEVVAHLNSVNPDTVEAADAQVLVSKIASEKTRVLAEREAKAKAVAEAGAAPPTAPSAARTPTDFSKIGPIPDLNAVDAGVADAGVKAEERPEGGMPEADFRAKFGICFDGPRAVNLPSGPVQAYQVKNRPDCAKYGGPDVSWYFAGGKLGGTFTEVAQKQEATTPPPDDQPKKPEPAPAQPAKPQIVFPPAPESVTIP
jgi:hypothetical protein